MNTTKIPWVVNDDGSPGKTWNPIVGCKHGCEWCYARKIAKRGILANGCASCKAFKPHIHLERLLDDHGQRGDHKRRLLYSKPGKTVFVGSMADMWGDWVPNGWIELILSDIRARPLIRFLTLTKNPKRYAEFDLPDNLWCGATVTRHSEIDRLGHLVVGGDNVFVSVEPMLDAVTMCFDKPFDIDWLIIGPLNNAKGGPVTQREWVERLIELAVKADIPVFLKPECEKIGFSKDEIARYQQVPWRKE